MPDDRPDRPDRRPAKPQAGKPQPGKARPTPATPPGDDRGNAPTIDPAVPPADDTGRGIPKQIGRFQIRGFLGAGAFGTVYRAYDPQLDREVALKVAQATAQSPERIQRFRREARAAAGLRHPNIVPLFEAGTADGHLYLASAFVPGMTLEDALREENPDGLPPEQSAAVVRKLADALAYAHGQKVLHRDVKSANIILDPDGEPHLLDFGLARRSQDADRMTVAGAVLGTPAYLAPEVARGDQSPWTPAVDQYALGIVLYELLTGHTPFAGPIEIVLALHQTQDPERPSRANPQVPRDLDAICLKCLEKDPARRYKSAADLAADLDRFLRGEPVTAQRQSFRYLTGKFVRRYRARLMVAAVILMATLGGTAGAFYKIDHERSLAVKAEKDASDSAKAALEANENLEDQLAANWIAVAERELTLRNDIALATSLLEKVPEKRRGWEWHYLMRLRDGAPLQSDPAERHKRGLWAVSYSPDGKRFATASIDSTVHVWDAATGRRLLKYEGHTLPLPVIDRNSLPIPKGLPIPDPTKILPGLPIPKMPLPVPDPRRVLPGAVAEKLPSIPVTCVAFSPDGRSVASGSVAPSVNPLNPKELRGVVRIWNPDTGADVLTFAEQIGVVLSIAYSPDGKRIASSSINDDNSFVVWDARTGEVVKVIRGHTSHVHRLRYSPDGKLIAAADNGGTLRLWDTNTFEEVRSTKAHPAAAVEVAFSPTGERVATGSNDGTVRVWDTGTGELALTLRGHYGSALSVTYSPDGKRIATGGFDNTVRLWDAATGTEKITLRGHADMVWGVAFSPDGSKLVSASFDGDFRIWDTNPRPETTGPGIFTITSLSDRVNVVAFSHDDRLLATGGWDNTVRLWDGRTGSALRTLTGHAAVVFGVAFDPRGERVASSSWDNKVKVWDTATGRELLTFHAHKAPVQSVAFSPDGRRVASTGWDGRVLIWDAATGGDVVVCEKFLGIALPTVSVAFSPDGRRIATGRTDRTVVVWDTRSGSELFTLDGHEGVIPCVRFSPDGTRLATASWDQTVMVWDVSGRTADKNPMVLKGHTDRVHGVAFSPDGARIASVGDDKTVRVWDAKTGKEVESLRRPHRAGVWSVAFGHDGRRLATACWSPSGWVKTWDAAPGGWGR
jgi:WD40 repeat protein